MNDTENETAAFNMNGTLNISLTAHANEVEKQEAIEQANIMNQTFREMEMRGTKISMKLGVASLDGSLSGEETDELEKFHRMSLPQKRAYI